GVYEMGSTLKTFTLAMALEEGGLDITDGFDASEPIRISRFTINDDHPQARWLSLPEIYMYSSNIGSAKMARFMGSDRQQAFLTRLGMMERPSLELPEISDPIVPRRWREISTMTVGFGHGIAVSALQVASGIAALTNGGIYHQPTLIKQRPGLMAPGERVVSEETSRTMQAMMRLVVEKGTGKKAEAKGYLVGGKTGTAEKAGPGGYRENALMTSFVGSFPIDDPRFVVFVMLDEPKGRKETFGFRGAGWNAAPLTSHIIERVAPMLGVAPRRATSHPGVEKLLETVRSEREVQS
ncbi:MAG: penicillin-binding transpeptidase domain-containing protein, partial [Alphaproteobacteria bacterium]|nr:penicillin-binding transpeptidase domain-containing protein [Alphaproteobacteria bacterium]